MNHDWVFFYNRKKDYTGELTRNAPYYIFGPSVWTASGQIFKMDKNDPNFLEESVRIMKSAAEKEGITMVSYGDAMTGDKVELEGKYKGLKKSVYTPYEVLWNETLSGFNPHEFEVMGVWKEGSSSYSSYRIWEEVAEREKTIRDNKL